MQIETRIKQQLKQLYSLQNRSNEFNEDDYNSLLLPMFIDNLLTPENTEQPAGAIIQLQTFTVDGETKQGTIPNEVHFTNGFATYRTNIGAKNGKYCFQVILQTSGLFQIGIFEDSSIFDVSKGIGDFSNSYAYDGYRQVIWNDGNKAFGKKWQKGDVITICCDFDNKTFRVFQNTEDLGVAFDIKTPENSYFFGVTASSGEKCIVNFGQYPMLYTELFSDYKPVMQQPLKHYRKHCEILSMSIKECMNGSLNANVVLLHSLLSRFIPLISNSKILCIDYLTKLMIELKEKNQLKRFVLLIKNLVNATDLDKIVQTLMEYYYILSSHFAFNGNTEIQMTIEMAIDIICDLVGMAKKNPKNMYKFIDMIMQNCTVLQYDEFMKKANEIGLNNRPEQLMIYFNQLDKHQLEIDKKLMKALEVNGMLVDYLNEYSTRNTSRNSDLEMNGDEMILRITFALFQNILDEKQSFSFCNDFLKNTPEIYEDYDRLGGTISYILKTFPIDQNRDGYSFNAKIHQAILFFINNANSYFNKIELVCRKNLGFSAGLDKDTNWFKYLWTLSEFILPHRYEIQMNMFRMILEALETTPAIEYVHEPYITFLNTMIKNLRNSIVFDYQKQLFEENIELIGDYMNLFIELLHNEKIVKPELKSTLYLSIGGTLTKRIEIMKYITPENQQLFMDFSFNSLKTEEESRYRRAITIIRLGLKTPFFVVKGNKGNYIQMNTTIGKVVNAYLQTDESKIKVHQLIFDFLNKNLDQLLLLLDKDRLSQFEEKTFELSTSNLLDATDLIGTLSYSCSQIYSNKSLSNKFLEYLSFVLYQCGVRKATTRRGRTISNVFMSLRVMVLNALNKIIKNIPVEKQMEWLLQDGILTTSIGKGLNEIHSVNPKIFQYEFEYQTMSIDRWTKYPVDRQVERELRHQEKECSEGIIASINLLNQVVNELNKKVTKKLVITATVDRRNGQRELQQVEIDVGDEDEDEEKLCKICYSNLADTMMLPCNHIACSNCIRKAMEKHKQCFFCTAKIEQLKQIDTDDLDEEIMD